MPVHATKKKVLFKDEFGLVQVEFEDAMRSYACEERRRPLPKERMTTDEVRTLVDVRDRLRDVRKGKELGRATACAAGRPRYELQ